MLWNKSQTFSLDSFHSEADLEKVILEVTPALFGPSRVYLDVKKKIGVKGGIRNIPDGYLIDMTSTKDPKLFVVEVELAKHEPLKHIAVQILEFSLSFETNPTGVKAAVKSALAGDPNAMQRCQSYAQTNGFENVDVLLERIVYGAGQFNALVIIDEVPEELETVLISRFKFPVEIVSLQRYRSLKGEHLYRFDPFLGDVGTFPNGEGRPGRVDPAEIDTIVVPAREEGFQEVFIGENCWYKIRIHSSMIPHIKFIAGYQTAPISAITHIAPVKSIRQYKDSSKYIVEFASPAEQVEQIKLVPKGAVKAPQAPRYTSKARLMAAKNLDDVF